MGALASAADETTDSIQSCTIITTQANELTRDVHDRMPVILPTEDQTTWLDAELADREQLEPLLKPLPSDEMTMDPVSTYVNSPRNEGPQCIAIQRELF